MVRSQRRLHASRLDPLGNGRALTAGNDEPVEIGEIGGGANLAGFGAELAQDAGVRLEVTLDR
jgi:hypothetical protein